MNKIKSLLIIVLLIIQYTNLNAQEESFRFGAKAGLNLSNVIGEKDDDNKSRTSFHVGAVVEIPLTEKFAVQPELLYSSQGQKNKDEFDITIKLDYLNIPIMAKYYAAKGLSIEGGPQLGFLLSAKYDGKRTDIDTGKIIDGTVDIKKNIAAFDLGLNFGLGYQLDMGVFFQSRYTIGLIDIFKNRDNNDSETALNSIIQLSVGYKF